MLYCVSESAGFRNEDSDAKAKIPNKKRKSNWSLKQLTNASLSKSSAEFEILLIRESNFICMLIW